MIIYIFIFLYLLFFSVYELYLKKNNFVHYYFYAVFIIFIILFLGFRQCGFDYENYYYYFQNLNSTYWLSNSEVIGSEKGYAYINYLLGDYRLVLLFMATITVFLIFPFFHRYSPFPYFTLLLFFSTSFFPVVMGQYRQALAIAIVLWAFIVKNKSIYIFFILIYIATLFHVTALLGCIALFLPKNIMDKKLYILFLVLALLFSFIGKELFYNMIMGSSDFITRKVEIYAEIEKGTRLGLNLAMLLRITLFSIFLIEKKTIEKFHHGAFFLNLYFVSLIIYLGLGFFPQVSGRGSIYFYFFEFILCAMVLSCNKKKSLIYFCMFLCLALYRYYSFFDIWYDDYIPYQYGINLF